MKNGYINGEDSSFGSMSNSYRAFLSDFVFIQNIVTFSD